jgi:hypothetical protein
MFAFLLSYPIPGTLKSIEITNFCTSIGERRADIRRLYHGFEAEWGKMAPKPTIKQDMDAWPTSAGLASVETFQLYPASSLLLELVQLSRHTQELYLNLREAGVRTFNSLKEYFPIAPPSLTRLLIVLNLDEPSTFFSQLVLLPRLKKLSVRHPINLSDQELKLIFETLGRMAEASLEEYIFIWSGAEYWRESHVVDQMQRVLEELRKDGSRPLRRASIGAERHVGRGAYVSEVRTRPRLHPMSGYDLESTSGWLIVEQDANAHRNTWSGNTQLSELLWTGGMRALPVSLDIFECQISVDDRDIRGTQDNAWTDFKREVSGRAEQPPRDHVQTSVRSDLGS